ncbi:MAG: hypothetical protein NTW96_16720 [Planctomycetia bacterium]|nr:hypothetical protein [Planctomycetia bacterium]
MTDTRNDAMLLLGPTGSGKTPLGDLLERRGLGGRRCVHFDFGAHLRRIVKHYAQLGAMLKTISVTAAMDPESAWRMLIPSRRE